MNRTTHANAPPGERIDSLMRFLWWCSGAVVSMLKDYPTEYSKYFGIGGAIFTTWLLATISGIYAFYTMIGSYFVAIPIGIVWGWVIFNLDRFITSSMKKPGNEIDEAFFSERIGAFLSEFLPAIPRILIAVIIGYSISIPLELRLFESEVLEQVKEIEKIEMQRYVERLRQERDKVISSLKSERVALKQEEDELREEYGRGREEIARMEERIKGLRRELQADLEEHASKITAFQAEITGTGGTGLPGYGKVAGLKEDLMKKTGDWYQSSQDQTMKRIESMGQRILEINGRHNQSALRLDRQLTGIETEIEKAKEAFEKEKDRVHEEGMRHGFLTQVKALYRVSAQEGNEAIEWAHTIFVLLIILVELGPIIVKLLSPRGPYDARVDRENKLAMIGMDNDVIKERSIAIRNRRTGKHLT
uniref:DUF4407 domain-containing protein n=1 Tax=Candidatus Kentrum eta TaxID=2126337 RepID=A0A450URK4_9GAMM|nr:MAG: protein of unknown function (DUF4407) [Candidatus Kentron sp. H]VFJ95159.1 MAG: protein of unknown function (DUF4407) [Candidatus Kentron sp. H]VFK01731.1 MAG: protein of unknown function (DUF4407) [Candidatus Kentron sp. H]